jgi:hypothetical protein
MADILFCIPGSSGWRGVVTCEAARGAGVGGGVLPARPWVGGPCRPRMHAAAPQDVVAAGAGLLRRVLGEGSRIVWCLQQQVQRPVLYMAAACMHNGAAFTLRGGWWRVVILGSGMLPVVVGWGIHAGGRGAP